MSGQVGLLKMVGLLTSASATGNAQLLVLNPLVGERVQGLASRLAMPTQGVASDGEVGGVSSFGFSGTIAHVLLRHVSKGSLVVSPLAYHRRAFTWHVGGARDGTKRASMYSVCWPAAPGAFASSARSVLLCRRAVPSEHGPVSSSSLCGVVVALLEGCDACAPSMHGPQLALVLAHVVYPRIRSSTARDGTNLGRSAAEQYVRSSPWSAPTGRGVV